MDERMIDTDLECFYAEEYAYMGSQLVICHCYEEVCHEMCLTFWPGTVIITINDIWR